MKSDDILMVQLRQNGHLSIGPLCIYIILERIKYLLERIFFFRDSMLDLPNVTIGAASEKVDCFVDLEHMCFNFFAHCFK
jgi:hypothetical protein